MSVDLETLVHRYKFDTELLNSHPEYTKDQKDLLNRRIERWKTDIAEYVSSEKFASALKAFNL